MDVFEIEPGRWVAEGTYDDRFIVVEGKTRHQALHHWSQTATGGMTYEPPTFPHH